jgi:hypothetical protein
VTTDRCSTRLHRVLIGPGRGADLMAPSPKEPALESTASCLGVEVNGALEMAEQLRYSLIWSGTGPRQRALTGHHATLDYVGSLPESRRSIYGHNHKRHWKTPGTLVARCWDFSRLYASCGLVTFPRVDGNPVHFPRLAAVIRKRLLEMNLCG